MLIGLELQIVGGSALDGRELLGIRNAVQVQIHGIISKGNHGHADELGLSGEAPFQATIFGFRPSGQP